MAISYHNIGIQEELLSNYIRASKNFFQSLQVLEKSNLKNEALYLKFKNHLDIFFRVI